MSRITAILVLVGFLGGGSNIAPAPPVAERSGPKPAPMSDGIREAVPESNADPDVIVGAAAVRDAELARLAAGFVDAYSTSEGTFTPDGKKIVFVSDRDGLPQIYVADATRPDAPATRLVTTGERAGGTKVTPDGKTVFFSSDTGADENWKIWRVGIDGSGLTDLTPGEVMSRDGAFIPEKAPDTLVFSARKVEAPTSTLYTMSAREPGDPKAIHRDEMPAFMTDGSADGKRAVWVRWPARGDNTVAVIDIASGKARTLYPKEGKATISDAVFTADGKRILVATDEGGEKAVVVALDARTGKQVARYVETNPSTATITDLLMSRTGNLVAVSMVAGNHSEIRLLDARTLKAGTRVDLPLGKGGAAELSADGKQLLAAWSTPGVPTDLHVVDTRSGRSALLRNDVRPTLAALPGLAVESTVLDAFDGLRLPVHVYLPAGAHDARRPVIVSYHGGPSGVAQVGWNPLAAFFVSLGYVWVEPNVRGSDGFGRAFEAADDGALRRNAIKDVETAARWAASQPWADPSRLVVFGGSYGGYTVLMTLSHHPDLWRAGIDAFGVVDLRNFMATTSGVIRQLFLKEFGDPDKDTELFVELSPSTHVGRIEDPLFVYAGANDPRVPLGESNDIVKRLRSRGIPVEYMVATNEGHSVDRRETQIELASRVARFLEVHVK